MSWPRYRSGEYREWCRWRACSGSCSGEGALTTVFVSHRGADGAVAERLATELRDRGHQVWLDTWEIGLGDSIVEKMNDGLTQSACLVLCYTDEGSASPWMSREWMSMLARQLGGAGVRLLPVRMTGGAPPAILADLKYADLAKDWPRGLAELCTALG
ncbi:toll/interleukin-1 receptor domain-containing protein [Streptomyces sp. NPDC050535]|uniref:toll/interleukin-1 receptor domain-containing protein n=1 Tax=Streptomyces sp. NPDC050535 TaxID=3365626 RepID=UPI00378E5911